MNKNYMVFIVGNWFWLVAVVTTVVAIVFNTIKMKKEEKLDEDHSRNYYQRTEHADGI